MFAGVIGARIFYVVQFHRQFEGHWIDALRIDKGGLVFYGGFILSLITLYIWCRVKKVHLLKLLDIFAPAIALGHALGRLGCFMQGCCFGKPAGSSIFGVSFPAGTLPAMRYPSDAAVRLSPSCPVYPTQLFECAFNLFLCGVLLLLLKTRLTEKPGRIAGIYLIAYGLLRSLTEVFRGDHTDFVFGVLTPAQTTAFFVMLPLGIIMYFTAGKWGSNGAAEN